MDSSYFILLFGMTIVTYLCRRLFLRIPDHILTKKIREGLAYVPIGIYAALVFPSLFLGKNGFQPNPIYLFSAVLCLLTMKVTNNFFLSFFIGMGMVLLGGLILNQ
ncbi:MULTISPECIES: AzlD domain-containing protein [Bacillus]|uniref:Branched-subunit amino acid transport protein n=1 Tax=Bacillus mycoides TaxID=1405 RepID=A0A3D9VDG1_BACMY|nr:MULTISPECIES: AzlD domain-containing protein [Bacillus]RBP30145.1 branched-subunit amino acid transport protein [Bacillus sp. DB-2]REF39788.1 branched-subunit amino acid transport protein [Bacillus mycoides]